MTIYSVRLTEQQRAQLSMLAQSTGRKPSDMVRYLLAREWQGLGLSAKEGGDVA
jgi:predicted DNA-binding protein